MRFRFSRISLASNGVYWYAAAFSGLGVPFERIPCSIIRMDRSMLDATLSASSSVSAQMANTATMFFGSFKVLGRNKVIPVGLRYIADRLPH